MEVVRQAFEVQNMRELLTLMEETVGIRKFQGWEEDQVGRRSQRRSRPPPPLPPPPPP